MAALGRAVCKTGPAEAGATHEPEAVSRHLSHVHATRMCECVGPRLTRQLDAARLNVSFEGVCRVICKTLLNAPIVFPLNFIMVVRRARASQKNKKRSENSRVIMFSVKDSRNIFLKTDILKKL